MVGVKDRVTNRVSAAAVPAPDQQTLQAGESVPGPAATHGLESFWALLKRGGGTCQRLSPKHWNCSEQEFVGHHNVHEQDTLEPMGGVVRQLAGQRLRYAELIQHHGLVAVARAV